MLRKSETGRAWPTLCARVAQLRLAPPVLLLIERLSSIQPKIKHPSPIPPHQQGRKPYKISITKRSSILNSLNNHRSCVHNLGTCESKYNLKIHCAFRSTDYFDTTNLISLLVALNPTKFKTCYMFSFLKTQILQDNK